MWAVWTHRRLTRSISAQQGMDLRSAADDLGKLHGLWVLVSLETRAHELLRPIFVPSIGRCAKVRRQGYGETNFNLRV